MPPILLFGIGILLVMALSGGASAGEKAGPAIDPEKPEPEPFDVPLPEGIADAPGGGLASTPGTVPGAGGTGTTPGGGLPVGVSAAEAKAREGAARAQAVAAGERARAAAAEAARQRAIAGAAAARRDAAAARDAAARASIAQASAAAEAKAARDAQGAAEAARREAEGRAAAEAAARQRDAQASAERAQADATKIAQLEGLVAQARGAANAKIKEAQDATAKANGAIRAANDARAAAGRAKTAAEKAQANANARIKAEAARRAGIEAAIKRANAATAEAQARVQEAGAALARAEKARKDAMDSASRASLEKDAALRAAAQREAALKDSLARSEEQRAQIAANNAAKAKEIAATAVEVAKEEQKKGPVGPTPIPTADAGPAPTTAPPAPSPLIETSPAVLEQKRQVVAKAFNIAVDKVMQSYAAAGKPITKAQAVNLVNSTLIGKGIPTGAPNAKDPRWKDNITALADKAAAAVNAIPLPQPKTPLPPSVAPGPAATPPPAPPPTPVTNDLEAKRQVVAEAFEQAVTAHEEYNDSVDKAAKVKNIDPFWLLDDSQVDTQLRTAVESFLPGPLTKPQPSVKIEAPETADRDRKKALIDAGFRDIGKFAGDTFKARLKKNYPTSWAQKVGQEYMRILLQDRAGKAMDEVQFWMLPIAQIQAKITEAARTLKKTITQEADLHAMSAAEYASKYGIPRQQIAAIEAAKARGVPMAGFIGAETASKRQKSVTAVAKIYQAAGIPLAKPDPRVAFWKQPLAVIRAKAQAARVRVPKPVPVRAVPGSDQLERKRAAIASAYQAATTKRKAALTAAKRAEPAATTTAAVVAHFKRRRIPLSRPPTISGYSYRQVA